jgi:hypothetical protein
MPMLEGQVDAVIGVDTHRDRHAAACWLPTAGCGPPWRCQPTGLGMPGCCSWPRNSPRPAGLGTGRDGLLAPTDPVEHRATVQALRLTAQQVLAARQDAHQLESELD